MIKEVAGVISQVNVQGASIIHDQRLKLIEAEANLQEPRHDLLLETKLKETNWKHLESATEEVKRVKNSLHEESNAIREIQRQNHTLKNEIFQQKLSLDNSGFSSQTANAEANILVEKGEQQKNNLNEKHSRLITQIQELNSTMGRS